MSKKDEVEKSLENEINQYDQFLGGAKDIADLVPGVQERKKEAEAKLTFVRFTPEDVFSEFKNQVSEIQMYDEQQVKLHLPELPRITPETTRYMYSGSATTSAYSEIYNTVLTFGTKSSSEEWTPPITQAFTVLSEEKAKKENLPEQLNNIQNGLGEMFRVALASFEKAKPRIVGVDQAAIQMRDVLEQLWGGLAELARERGPKKYRGTRLELRRQRSRDIVVECLSDNVLTEKKLVILLNNMATIHSELSDSEFGKNPLSDDVEKLDILYRRWIFIVDDVVNYINLNIGL